jgi:hypothetical protein
VGGWGGRGTVAMVVVDIGEFRIRVVVVDGVWVVGREGRGVRRGGGEGEGGVVEIVVLGGGGGGDREMAGAGRGVRGGVVDGVEDGGYGADDVELDDGAPEDAFFAEGGRGVEALELWGTVRRGAGGEQRRGDIRRRVVDLPDSL